MVMYNPASSGEHLVAGLKGLAHGVFGGITSLLAQSYDGATSDGLTGFVAGVGKGIVGTVTKPAVGILDLATGAASAIRDSSRTSSRMIPERCRPSRVATGNGGLLPIYSEMAAKGQELLFEVNDKNYKELFIGHETLISGPGRELRVLISSQSVTVFKPSKGNPVMLKVSMSDLLESKLVLVADKGAFIELIHRLADERGAYGQLTRPQVSCENESVARKVVEQINYAKVLFEELRHSQVEKSSPTTDY